ncbi:hypothetical protein GRF29_216g764381 [Pseudopithomyces chartarum]|uniref:Cyanovirin-N domain-containing protein n=1 Tax=Pseudopithomyces chartarum TaxID=1892770 RepID=A0AAN6LLR0_9PLEO|nr:hypothetical protein GRF29_216g764381 [Pseudopithomyces chartarum]
MKFVTTLVTFALLTISVLTSALPQHTVPTAAPSVTMQLSKTSTCSADGTFEVSTVCKKFPAGTESLRVSSVASDGKVRYNSRNFLVNLQTEKTGKAIAVENAKWGCTCEKEESMDSLKKGIMLLK